MPRRLRAWASRAGSKTSCTAAGEGCSRPARPLRLLRLPGAVNSDGWISLLIAVFGLGGCRFLFGRRALDGLDARRDIQRRHLTPAQPCLGMATPASCRSWRELPESCALAMLMSSRSGSHSMVPSSSNEWGVPHQAARISSLSASRTHLGTQREHAHSSVQWRFARPHLDGALVLLQGRRTQPSDLPSSCPGPSSRCPPWLHLAGLP
jgi:hypothetical protein